MKIGTLWWNRGRFYKVWSVDRGTALKGLRQSPSSRGIHPFWLALVILVSVFVPRFSFPGPFSFWVLLFLCPFWRLLRRCAGWVLPWSHDLSSRLGVLRVLLEGQNHWGFCFGVGRRLAIEAGWRLASVVLERVFTKLPMLPVIKASVVAWRSDRLDSSGLNLQVDPLLLQQSSGSVPE